MFGTLGGRLIKSLAPRRDGINQAFIGLLKTCLTGCADSQSQDGEFVSESETEIGIRQTPSPPSPDEVLKSLQSPLLDQGKGGKCFSTMP
jgi:hypothetical protein